MPVVAHKKYWRQNLVSQGTDYFEMASTDVYKRWTTNRAPDLAGEAELIWGLKVAFGDPDHQVSQKFFSRAVEIVDRALAERKFESELCQGGFPANVGRALRTKAYGISITTGDTQEALFRESSRCFLKYCQQETQWESLAQNYYLSGVRIALLAGDHELAQTVFEAGRAPEHKEEPLLLQELIVAAGTDQRLSTKAQDGLEKLFERTRDPHYSHRPPLNVVIGPFEIACLHDKYVVSQEGKVDWRRVITDFSS